MAPIPVGDSTEEKLKVQIRTRLAQLDTIIMALTPLAEGDADAKVLLTARVAERTAAVRQLKEAKPLAVQLQAAVAAKDKAIKRYDSCRGQLAELSRLVAVKEQEVLGAEAAATAAAAECSKLLALQVAAGGSGLGLPLPVPPQMQSLAHAAQGFAALLPTETAERFVVWLSLQPPPPPPAASQFQSCPQPGSSSAAVVPFSVEDSDDELTSPALVDAYGVPTSQTSGDPSAFGRQLATMLVQHSIANGYEVPLVDLTSRQGGPADPHGPFRLKRSEARVSPLGASLVRVKDEVKVKVEIMDAGAPVAAAADAQLAAAAEVFRVAEVAEVVA